MSVFIYARCPFVSDRHEADGSARWRYPQSLIHSPFPPEYEHFLDVAIVVFEHGSFFILSPNEAIHFSASSFVSRIRC